MKKILAVILALIVLLTSGCSIKGAEVENTKEEDIETGSRDYVDVSKLDNLFGFTNETGEFIISIETSEADRDMKFINKAIGENGNMLSLKYVRHQQRNEKDNGRQTAGNFDNISGDVFEVVEGKAEGNETYYLVNDKEFNTGSVLGSQAGDQSSIDDEAKKEIEKTKNRRIEDSWEIGRIESDIKLYLVLFERQGDDMLACVVMKTPVKIVYKDYPAKYNESSTWRVDDGGNIYPDLFSILFSARTEEGVLLGLKWAAAEGENTFLLVENGNEFEVNIETGRYMSPA